MVDRLAGITAKIERAEKHIDDLQTEWIAFGGRAYEIWPDDHFDEGGRRNFRIRIKEGIPPSLSTTVGDAVSNLRSALDYLIYQLLDAKGVEVGRHHGFPISASAKQFEASHRRKVQGVGDEAERLIKGRKPYKGGNDDFWYLNELRRTDQHRLLITVLINPIALGLNLSDMMPPRLPGVSEADHERMLTELRGSFITIPGKAKPCPVLKDGDIVYSQPGDMDSHKHTQLAFVIAFAEGEILECDPVVATLRRLLDTVKGAIEPFRPLLV